MAGMSLARDISDMLDRKRAAAYALLQNWSGHLEGYAKENAPWTDRTSHARQGLHSGVELRGKSFVLYLSHGVEYGIWLEIAAKPKELREVLWDKPGPYAIVEPTMRLFEPRVKASMKELFRK
jgi:hypothetical protein